MDYKIIVLDLDGTLTNRDKIITPRTKEALMNAQEAGNVVVLASGRPTAGVEPLARELELSRFGSYILSYNGGMITNCKTGETVFSSLLPRESNQKIIGLAEEHRVDILTYEGEEIITNNVECPYAIAESNINHLPLRQVEDMKSYVDFKVPKFLMLDDGDYLVTVEPKIISPHPIITTAWDLWLRSSCCPERDRENSRKHTWKKCGESAGKNALIKSPVTYGLSDFNMLK